MKIYLTGGTGFIGSYVLKALSDAGHHVIVLARNPNKVPLLRKLPGVKIIKCPVDNYAAVKKHLKKADALIHIALCWGDTGPEMMENETLPSLRLIDLAVKRGIKRIIYTSSTAAQGLIQHTTDESAKPTPADFYGATKASIEMFMNAYANYRKDILFNIIRPGYTFGNPVVQGGSMESDKRFRNICSLARDGRDITQVKHDGTQFISAADLAKLYTAVLASNKSGQTYYGLGSVFITWEYISRYAAEFTQSGSKVKLKDLGWSDKPAFYSVKRIKKEFGLKFDAREDVKEHVQYLVMNSRVNLV
ncbi:MAG: NAD(P)-dependent oxidoreductase [Spirochaetia bacterium]|nr:NAD(P)-dependent oxidoreductase [Spirochaetia bacterium]